MKNFITCFIHVYFYTPSPLLSFAQKITWNHRGSKVHDFPSIDQQSLQFDNLVSDTVICILGSIKKERTRYYQHIFHFLFKKTQVVKYDESNNNFTSSILIISLLSIFNLFWSPTKLFTTTTGNITSHNLLCRYYFLIHNSFFFSLIRMFTNVYNRSLLFCY